MKKILFLLFFNLFSFSQTNIKVPEGWFIMTEMTDYNKRVNLETAVGKEGAIKIKNFDKLKQYNVLFSYAKYDVKTHFGVSPTVNFAVIKNTQNWVFSDFQNTTKTFLTQLENAGLKNINLKQSKSVYLENGKKVYKLQVEYKLPKYNDEIILTQYNYFITNKMFAQLALIGIANDKCKEAFNEVLNQLSIVDN
jgi:hypothetical protein